MVKLYIRTFLAQYLGGQDPRIYTVYNCILYLLRSDRVHLNYVGVHRHFEAVPKQYLTLTFSLAPEGLSPHNSNDEPWCLCR